MVCSARRSPRSGRTLRRMSAVVTRPAARPAPLGRRPRRWVRPWAPVAVAGLLTGLIALALAGAALDDAAIDARTGQATARVLAVTQMRTLVQFAASNGKVYRPEQGVAYPSGLQPGQLVRVEYDIAYPEHVRVAGRSWVAGLTPAALALAALWILVVPTTWWLHRLVGRSSSTANPVRSCT
jgi:hypothetical protein